MSRALLAVTAGLLPMVWAQQTAPAPPPPEPVPLTQIAFRGEELTRMLRDLSQQLPPETELDAFYEQLAADEEEVAWSLRETNELLARDGAMVELREQARQWRTYGISEPRQRKVLSGWGGACEHAIATLKTQQAIWQATLAGMQKLPELDSVRAGVRQNLKDIRALRGTAEDRLRIVVELQGRLSKRALTIAETQEKVNKAMQMFQERLFVPDAPPIWKAGAEGAGAPLGRMFGQSVERSYRTTVDLVRSQPGTVAQSLGFLALAFVVIQWLRRAVLKSNSTDPAVEKAAALLRRQISLSILLAAPGVIASLPVARLSATILAIQVFLIPIARLLPQVAGCRPRAAYFIAAFYALPGLASVLNFDAGGGRVLSAVLYAGVLAVLGWWSRPRRMRRVSGRDLLIARAAFGVVGLIFLANILGFLLLSNFLRLVAVLSSYVGLIMFMLARAVAILIAGAVRTTALSSLATVRLHRAAVLRWTRRVVGLGAALWWASMALDLLALKNDVVKGIARVLGVRIGVKAFSVSLGDLLGAACVLIFGLLLAAAVRFVLREEVLARVRLARGIPDAVSTACYYVLALLAVLMSLSAAGVQLDKLTVLTGAFGVGVGFGMQTLVSNFVSGLVLQFERPIRIGDVLEVGNLSGEVRQIGVRASLIRTFQGAEVIVPNATLVSNQVVNWTLSEQLRRVELQVPVAYGTEPERVIGILCSVAKANPEVLREPEPGAFFQGFGPSSLDFLLIFWAEQSTHFRLRSEVAIAVNASLRDAGIKIALPQREVRVLSADAPQLQSAAGLD